MSFFFFFFFLTRVGECVFVFDPRWDSFSMLMRDWCHFYRRLCIQTPGGSRTLSHGLYERLPPPHSHPPPVPASFNPITNLHQPIPLVTVQRSASLLPISICICFCLSCCFLRMNQRTIRNAWISFFCLRIMETFLLHPCLI